MKISDLPRDSVEEILSRVPAISLKRLRSTCKRWNRFFNDVGFARKHFDKAAKQSLVFMVTNDFRICLMSVNLHETPYVEFKIELSLLDSHSNSTPVRISQVFHCAGLLLCTIKGDTRIVLWNPCTGQTRWIQPRNPSKIDNNYALGSYQDSESGNSNYKILSYRGYNHGYDHESSIYEVDSHSWRFLDVTPDFKLLYIGTCVSLKGKTYWFASDRKEEQLGMFLVSFDYTAERFGRLRLPYKCPLSCFQSVALSLVGEEKLAVLLLRKNTWGKEIWVTDKIDETKVVSWRKVLTVDYPERDIWITLSCFLVDEEKKAVMCCEKCIFNRNTKIKNLAYIVGEDKKVTQLVDFGAATFESCWPIILDYVPSLVQIQPGG